MLAMAVSNLESCWSCRLLLESCSVAGLSGNGGGLPALIVVTTVGTKPKRCNWGAGSVWELEFSPDEDTCDGA